MGLPTEISPNPLITSSVEVRFLSDKKNMELFPIVYGKFMNDLPNLNEGNIPKDIKNSDPQFQHFPDYILSNDKYTIGFSDKVLIFENINEYPFWANYFDFISQKLSAFLELGFVKQVQRIGVRYISVLGETTFKGNRLKNIPSLSLEGYNEKFLIYHTHIKVDDCVLFLRIGSEGKLTREKSSLSEGKTLSGTYVDIDASFTGDLSPDISHITYIIDKLHTLQKDVFFKLLNPEYLDSLNPKY